MDRTLETHLCKIYPEFISGSEAEAKFGCCCETDNGWYPLLASLFSELGALSKQHGATFTARQVKEKFGTLRVYFDCESDGDADAAVIAHLLVEVAQYLSGSLCEVCGNPAKTTSFQGWYRTLCPLHSIRPTPSIYIKTAPSLIARLLELPRPRLDLSLLLPIGRLERSAAATHDICRLTLVRYRSMESYAATRVIDIELREEVGWYGTFAEARDAAQKLNCYWLETRELPIADSSQQPE